MKYSRQLDLPALLKKKSHFLFGPRGTGKTTLIRQSLPNATVFDLLDAKTYTDLLREPGILAQVDPGPGRLIVIDEIQKLPALLNEVHRLIESKQLRFLLTGSSARKLRRGAANLLGGRAWQANLFPLTWREIPNFNLIQYLNRGGIPFIYQSPNFKDELRNYVSLYLRDEIQAEATVRNVDAFARFLDAAALTNGEEIQFQSLSSDSGIPARSLANYFQILEDTLLGFALLPFTRTKKRKAITRNKFYLFDVGVTNTLCRRGAIQPKSELFGRAFEQFLICEVRAFLSYKGHDSSLQYWRSTSQFEVDLIVGTDLAIEIKGTELVTDKHLKGLRALKEEKIIRKHVVVSLDSRKRKLDDGIEIWPWSDFLEALWGGDLVK